MPERLVLVPLLLVMLALALLTSLPAAAVQLDQHGCQVMAIWGRDLVWARDMGADKEKVKKFLEEEKKESPVFEVLLNYFDFVWKTDVSGVKIMESLYHNCLLRRGQYGDGADT